MHKQSRTFPPVSLLLIIGLVSVSTLFAQSPQDCESRLDAIRSLLETKDSAPAEELTSLLFEHLADNQNPQEAAHSWAALGTVAACGSGDAAFAESAYRISLLFEDSPEVAQHLQAIQNRPPPAFSSFDMAELEGARIFDIAKGPAVLYEKEGQVFLAHANEYEPYAPQDWGTTAEWITFPLEEIVKDDGIEFHYGLEMLPIQEGKQFLAVIRRSEHSVGSTVTQNDETTRILLMPDRVELMAFHSEASLDYHGNVSVSQADGFHYSLGMKIGEAITLEKAVVEGKSQEYTEGFSFFHAPEEQFHQGGGILYPPLGTLKFKDGYLIVE